VRRGAEVAFCLAWGPISIHGGAAGVGGGRGPGGGGGLAARGVQPGNAPARPSPRAALLRAAPPPRAPRRLPLRPLPSPRPRAAPRRRSRRFLPFQPPEVLTLPSPHYYISSPSSPSLDEDDDGDDIREHID
jgi:hypothetical protein